MAVQSGEIWSVDTEWGFRDGRVDQESAWEPVVLCLVGLRSGRRLHFWGRDPRLRAFFVTHATDLFVSHYAVAEMKYLIRLGVPLPARWFDTFVAWRYLTNRPNNLEAGLAAALGQLGLSGLAPAQKKELQQKILHLRFNPDSAADRCEIIDYCLSDCDGCAALYCRVGTRIPAEHMAHWAEYLKAVARLELRGIPFDVEHYCRIREARPVVAARLTAAVNVAAPVYEKTGKFHKKAFLAWCRKVGIDWPAKVSEATGRPYFCFEDEVWKEMEARHPLIAEIRQVSKTLEQFERRSLAIDPALGRHFYNTSVFRSVTGRNQPRGFVFGGPKWLRFLILSESPSHALAYVDYTAQEVGIAAALSGDPTLRSIYEAEDCHMAFPIRAGAAPAWATKATHPKVRKQYKTVNLGVLYGQTAFGIANRLGIPQQQAQALLDDHRALFPAFWRWSERMVQGAYDRGWISTPCGWRSKVPFPSNERTWMNWPMQGTGGDIMRLTVTYLDRQCVRVLAPVHDGFLLSCRRDQLADLRAAVDYACGMAVEHVLPGFPLRWDLTVYENGRFEDEDGLLLWNRLQGILKEASDEG